SSASWPGGGPSFMRGKDYGLSFVFGILGICGCLILGQSSSVGASRGLRSHTSQVAITSPQSGATVSGTVPITAQTTSQVTWVNFYVDNSWIASSPPYTDTWLSSTVA